MNKTKKVNMIIGSIVLVLCMANLTVVAWFAQSLRANGNLNFTTSSQEQALNLLIGRVTTGNNTAAHTFSEAIEHSTGASTVKKYYPGGLEPRPATGTNITLDNVTFGNINNLVEPNPENIVYLRLEIPEATGANLNFALSYTDVSSNHLNAYSYNGTSIGAAVGEAQLSELRKLESPEDGGKSLLQYQFYLSQTPYTSGEEVEAVENMSWSDTYNFYQYGYTDPDGQYNTTTDHIEQVIAEYNKGSKYYLYIKITPNLDIFAQTLMVDGIPASFFMDFDINMHFEIAEAVSEAKAAP